MLIVGPGKELVSEPFSISNLNISPGEYNNSEAQIVFWTNKNKDMIIL